MYPIRLWKLQKLFLLPLFRMQSESRKTKPSSFLFKVEQRMSSRALWCVFFPSDTTFGLARAELLHTYFSFSCCRARKVLVVLVMDVIQRLMILDELSLSSSSSRGRASRKNFLRNLYYICLYYLNPLAPAIYALFHTTGNVHNLFMAERRRKIKYKGVYRRHSKVRTHIFTFCIILFANTASFPFIEI